MAKYTITHKCGHEEEIALFGKMDERERRIAWLESQPCLACKYADAVERTGAVASEMGVTLPKLSGSEKQIAWAESIRSKVVYALRRVWDAGREKDDERGRMIVDNIATQYLAEDVTAKAWIDGRYEYDSLNDDLDAAVSMIREGIFE